MIGLWIAAAVIVAAVLGALLRTLLLGGRSELAADNDLAVYRDQLAEVERDVERGILAEDQAEAARTEIKRRMLAAADADAAVAASARPVPPALRGAVITAIAILIPAGSLGIYTLTGSPSAPDMPLASRGDRAPAMAEAEAQHEMAGLTERLAEQMEKDPNRPEGWLLLARSYRTMQRYNDAASAFGKAAELTDRDPAVLSEMGEALILGEGGKVPETALKLFREGVDKSPTEPRSRFYLGVAKAQQGDPKGAVQEWLDLLAVSPPDAPWAADVQGQIRVVAAENGIEVAAMTPSPGLPEPPAAPVVTAPAPQAPMAPPFGAALPAPSNEDMKAASEMTPEERQQMIRSMVEGLAARLEDEPGDAAGWRRLARAYQVLGETEKAKDALARAEKAEAGK